MDTLDAGTYSDQISNAILANIESVEDLDFASEVCSIIKGTTVEGQLPVYEYCSKFAKDHGKYPSYTILKTRFGDKLEDPGLEWTKDFILEFLVGLKRESFSNKASVHMSLGELEEASNVLASIPTTKKRKDFNPEDTITEYEKIISSPSGIPTGIKEIDDDLKGMSYGTVTVFGAPPSMYKTTLMVSVLYNAVNMGGFNGVSITLEVKKEHLWFHLMARHSFTMGNKIPAQSMIKGIMTEEEWDFYKTQLVPDWNKKCKGVLRILDPGDFEGGMSFSAITRELIRLDGEMIAKTGNGLDIVWLDYIQLMKFYRGKADPDHYLNDVVRYFGNLSITFKGRGLVVVLNSQINRQGERKIAKNKVADNTMLAEINELERTGNAVGVLYSDAGMRLANQLKVQLVKNRNGKVQAEMVNVFVDSTCGLIGATDFAQIFSQSSVDVLGITSEDDDALF